MPPPFTIAIMQPYFLPYIGYWQLINSADLFVLYDTIQYTKKGWINRNRFLLNGEDKKFSLPLQSDSDMLYVNKRFLAESFERKKLVRQFHGAYGKAPYYKENFPIIEDIIRYEERNLFSYIENSVQKICAFLEIETKIILSSALPAELETLKGADRVVGICKACEGDRYINPIGGLNLYDKTAFRAKGLELDFLKARALDYDCFGKPALPHMSILDVMMFNSKAKIQESLHAFDWV